MRYIRARRHEPRRTLPMLVCQCNVITNKQIEEVVLSFLRADPWEIIVPAKVYRELEKRCKCSGCVPNVVDIITSVTEQYHRQLAADPTSHPEPKQAAAPRQTPGDVDEGRSSGNRAA
jgi:bacterioferritin-associated ferredoxin